MSSLINMDHSTLVSILIPCYNAERFVGEAIESALAQTHPNIEVIVVDDGSTDGSVEVIKSFGDRIRWESGPNRGGCAARNRALALSRGEFIQFLDADDLLLPAKIELQLPELAANQADMVFCAGSTLLPSGEIIHPGTYPDPRGCDPLLYLLEGRTIATNGSLHRRRCLERVGGFREGLPRAQEWDLHVRLAGSGVRLATADRPLFVKRHHGGGHVSHYQPPAGYLPSLLFDNVEWFDQQGWLDRPGRRAALAPIVHRHAKYAFLGGAKPVAQRGFELARRLSNTYRPLERWWIRASIRCIGPMNTEQLLQLGRSMRTGLQRHRL